MLAAALHAGRRADLVVMYPLEKLVILNELAAGGAILPS
jgi:hypothetical protein